MTEGINWTNMKKVNVVTDIPYDRRINTIEVTKGVRRQR